MIFRTRDDGRFEIPAAVESQLRAHAQHRESDLEACGFLICSVVEESVPPILTLTAISEPGPKDARERYGCERLDPCHQEALERAWNERRDFRLGEWHSHAEPFPTPSDLDMATWRGCLAEARRKGLDHRMFFLIVGTLEIRAWEGDWTDASVVRLEQQAAEHTEAA